MKMKVKIIPLISDDDKVALNKMPGRKCPWPDFNGLPIYDGDTLTHPSGEKGRVVYLKEFKEDSDRWRVDYGNGDLGRLCLQVGDKGMAEKENK